jgi:NADH-quinone oxidoreductase subunit G
VILIVGSNPRIDAPLVNTRIRKAVRKHAAKVFRIGPVDDLSYPVHDLGDDLALLAALPADVADALAAAKLPAVVLGARAISGDTGAAVLAAARAIGDTLQRDGWNGFSVLHTAASRVGALDIGFTGAVPADARVLLLLGVDEVAPQAPGALRVYIGSHGDAGAKTADVILPGAAYLEKPGTYVNMEGRVQRSLRAFFPPGDAREDWTILRALADVLGVTLRYNDLPALRARIAAEWPHLGREGLHIVPWQAGGGATVQPLASTPCPPAAGSFYRSNPIARASATMAACVAEIAAPALLQAAE